MGDALGCPDFVAVVFYQVLITESYPAEVQLWVVYKFDRLDVFMVHGLAITLVNDCFKYYIICMSYSKFENCLLVPLLIIVAVTIKCDLPPRSVYCRRNFVYLSTAINFKAYFNIFFGTEGLLLDSHRLNVRRC